MSKISPEWPIIFWQNSDVDGGLAKEQISGPSSSVTEGLGPVALQEEGDIEVVLDGVRVVVSVSQKAAVDITLKKFLYEVCLTKILQTLSLLPMNALAILQKKPSTMKNNNKDLKYWSLFYGVL